MARPLLSGEAMDQTKCDIGELEVKLYALVKEAIMAGVRESDLRASFDACLETARWAKLQKFENVVPIESARASRK